MDGQQWRPLFTRDSEEATEYDVLHEGVPEWLEGSIWRWLMDRAAEGGPNIVTRLERRLHLRLAEPRDRILGTQHTPPNELFDRYWKQHFDDDRLVLLDAILFDLQLRGQSALDEGNESDVVRFLDGAQRLNDILTEGGSAWSAHIEPPVWSLVRRVNDTTAELAKRVGTPSTDAARKIRAAWQACYRISPDPDVAYRNAVLALEAVAIPQALPDSKRATLGTVVAHIRDTVGLWSVGGLDAKQIASGETLLAMMQTLWHNQERHARGDGTIVDVTQPEAEAAVTLAVTLVHWFTAGLVTKADKP